MLKSKSEGEGAVTAAAAAAVDRVRALRTLLRVLVRIALDLVRIMVN